MWELKTSVTPSYFGLGQCSNCWPHSSVSLPHHCKGGRHILKFLLDWVGGNCTRSSFICISWKLFFFWAAGAMSSASANGSIVGVCTVPSPVLCPAKARSSAAAVKELLLSTMTKKRQFWKNALTIAVMCKSFTAPYSLHCNFPLSSKTKYFLEERLWIFKTFYKTWKNARATQYFIFDHNEVTLYTLPADFTCYLYFSTYGYLHVYKFCQKIK